MTAITKIYTLDYAFLPFVVGARKGSIGVEGLKGRTRATA